MRKMRSQSHDNSPIIPDHVKPEWDALTEELRVASAVLTQMQERHRQATLARIVIVAEIEEHETSQEWQTASKELDDAKVDLHQAHKRYHEVIAARIAIVAIAYDR